MPTASPEASPLVAEKPSRALTVTTYSATGGRAESKVVRLVVDLELAN